MNIPNISSISSGKKKSNSKYNLEELGNYYISTSI